MSLFATLYATAPSTPAEAISAALPGRAWTSRAGQLVVELGAMDVCARLRSRPNFDGELWGIEAKTSLCFAIDKFRLVEAREQLAAAVASFLRNTTGDVVVLYLDVVVLRRVEADAVCAAAYEDMLPPEASRWRIVSSLPQPE